MVASISDLVTAVSTAGLFIAAAVTAYLGLRAYRVQAREKHARWLVELLGRFSSDPAFQRVRRDLYNADACETVAALRRKETLRTSPRSSDELTPEQTRVLVDLDDYLGFFELIDRLVAGGELRPGEAARLFAWYLAQALRIEDVRKEVTRDFHPIVFLARRLDLGVAREALVEANASRRATYTSDFDPAPSFYCECGSRSCRATVAMSLEEYDGREGPVLTERHALVTE